MSSPTHPDFTQSTLALFKEHEELVLKMHGIAGEVAQASQWVVDSLKGGGCLFLCGNGGSAGDAQHIAGEFVSRFLMERRALPAIALHTNTTVMTAIANDYSFDVVFSRQIEAHAKPNDVLFAISTSGNSVNVLRAVEAAKAIGMKTVGLTNDTGGKLKDAVDLCVCVPSPSTPRVQEMHILIGHIVCELAEAGLC